MITLRYARRPRGVSPPNTRDCTGEKFGRYLALAPAPRRTADGGRYWLCWDAVGADYVERSLITLRALRRKVAA